MFTKESRGRKKEEKEMLPAISRWSAKAVSRSGVTHAHFYLNTLPPNSLFQVSRAHGGGGSVLDFEGPWGRGWTSLLLMETSAVKESLAGPALESGSRCLRLPLARIFQLDVELVFLFTWAGLIAWGEVASRDRNFESLDQPLDPQELKT